MIVNNKNSSKSNKYRIQTFRLILVIFSVVYKIRSQFNNSTSFTIFTVSNNYNIFSIISISSFIATVPGRKFLCQSTPKTIPKYAVWNTEVIWRRILLLCQSMLIHALVRQQCLKQNAKLCKLR